MPPPDDDGGRRPSATPADRHQLDHQLASQRVTPHGTPRLRHWAERAARLDPTTVAAAVVWAVTR